MKRLFFTGLLAFSLMSSTSINEVRNDSTSNLNLEIPCTVTCSITIGGVTQSTTGGNWFSSCERASRRCMEKLTQLINPN